MALVLVRLRLTIAGRVRGHGAAASGYYLTSWAIALAFGLIGGMGTAVFASQSGLGSALLLGSFIMVSMPWLLGPILEPTLADGTVDPQRLEQFPLTAGQQVGGLLAGALLAPTAAFTFLFSVGPAAAIGVSPLARVAAVAGAISFTVMCVAVSRAAQALLAESLRSRRGRDLAALAAALLVLGLYGVTMHLRSTISSVSDQLSGPLGSVAAWTSPGAAAQAMTDLREGAWLDFALRVGIVLATIAAAVAVWMWALNRRVRGDSSTLARGYHRSTRDALPLVPHGLRFLPDGPLTAAMAQQWRYFFFRSPKAIQTLIIPPVMGVMVAHTTFGSFGLEAQAAAFAALAVVVGSFNVFGYDGPGFRYLIASGAPAATVMLGKVLAPLLYLLPILVVFVTAEGFLQQSPQRIGWALVAGLCVIATGVGIGAQSSVRNPNDQSRVGVHRQGMFLKVFAWFTGFFLVVACGAAVWQVVTVFWSEALAAGSCLVIATVLCVTLVTRAGRRLDRDPQPVLDRLDPAAY